MKKTTLLLACLAASITSSFAQEGGDSSLGFNLNYASGSSFGIGARFQYNLTNTVRIEPEINYYIKNDNCHFWDVGANFSYLLPVARDVTVYPLVGFGYMQGAEIGLDYTADPYQKIDTTFGSFQAKLGIGAEFQILSNAKLIIEPKYQFANFDDICHDFKNQFVITAGIALTF